MGAPRRFAIPNDCLSCTLRRSCDFCNLPQPLMAGFNAMGHLTLHPANTTLLMEGQIPRGVYIACSGRSKLSVEARDGKTIILKIAGERQVLGPSAVVSRGPSLITVTTIELCQTKFVERDSFLRLIEHDSHAALACTAMLARSSTEKLAPLQLSWVSGGPRNRELRVAAEFTHEEIAQMIGSSRETVTRLSSDMKRKDLIRLEGATLVIPNRIA
jgi:CRP/FNR family transcriptional regulator, cyclic AMP receptor protein